MGRLTKMATSQHILYHLIVLLSICTTILSSKVFEFGTKLPDYVKENPEKIWLVKFYTNWCPYCQQLEPIFINAADKIYRRFDNVIVGQIDCAKFKDVCDTYGVSAYPQILHLNKDNRIEYFGERTPQLIFEFVTRLSGPDVKLITNCKHLEDVVERENVITLFTQPDESGRLFQQYRLIASKLKATHWFYHSKQPCNTSLIAEDGIYILKKDLNRAIKFEQQNETSTDLETKQAIHDWVIKETYPVFGFINSHNFDPYSKNDKPIVITILDQYWPAKKISLASKTFFDMMSEFAIRYVQDNDQYMFAWTTDMDFIQKISIGSVVKPNLMILNPDVTYYIYLEDERDVEGFENDVPTKLKDLDVSSLIESHRSSKLRFRGGNSYYHRTLKNIYFYYNRLSTIYYENPLLASILFSFPIMISVFVIYTTCISGDGGDSGTIGQNGISDAEDSEDEGERDRIEGRPLLNHAKQD